MTRFVLLGARRFPPAEISPASVAVDIGRAILFMDIARRWRLLDSCATGPAEVDQPRALLMMWAGCPAAAASLAEMWSQVTGFDVSVWPLVGGRNRRSA
jgi:hypothetical protein